MIRSAFLNKFTMRRKTRILPAYPESRQNVFEWADFHIGSTLTGSVFLGMASILGQCQYRYRSFTGTRRWASHHDAFVFVSCWWDLSQDSVAPNQLYRLQVKKKTRSDGKWNACSEAIKEILILCGHLIQLYLRLVLCDGPFVCFNSSSCTLKTRSKHSTIIGSISLTGIAFIHLQHCSYKTECTAICCGCSCTSCFCMLRRLHICTWSGS